MLYAVQRLVELMNMETIAEAAGALELRPGPISAGWLTAQNPVTHRMPWILDAFVVDIKEKI